MIDSLLMSITQADIARRVGVSRTAVSHVLNGRSYMVGPEVRERILTAVETAGYHRNALVRALKANRTHVVGIIVPGETISFFVQIIEAAEAAAAACGLQCFLCQSLSSSEALEKHVVALREYRVDGLLLVPTAYNNKPDIYRLMQEQDFPFVLVDCPSKGSRPRSWAVRTSRPDAWPPSTSSASGTSASPACAAIPRSGRP